MAKRKTVGARIKNRTAPVPGRSFVQGGRFSIGPAASSTLTVREATFLRKTGPRAARPGNPARGVASRQAGRRSYQRRTTPKPPRTPVALLPYPGHTTECGLGHRPIDSGCLRG
jgi:hypothetical protein